MKSTNHVKCSLFIIMTALVAVSEAFQLPQQHVTTRRDTSSCYAISSKTLDNRISPIMDPPYNHDGSTAVTPSIASTTSNITPHFTPRQSSMTYFEACTTLTTSVLSRIASTLLSSAVLSPRRRLSQILLLAVTQVMLQDIQWRMLRLAALLAIKVPVYLHHRLQRDLRASLEEMQANNNNTCRQLAFTELGHYLLGTYCLEW
jgi:hypothetical protein